MTTPPADLLMKELESFFGRTIQFGEGEGSIELLTGPRTFVTYTPDPDSTLVEELEVLCEKYNFSCCMLVPGNDRRPANHRTDRLNVQGLYKDGTWTVTTFFVG